MFRVLYYPHALLSKKASAVLQFNEELRTFLKELLATMYEFDGGGIAAPQVGVSKRIFISDFGETLRCDREDKSAPPFFYQVFDAQGNEKEVKFPAVFINPEIVKQDVSIQTDWEGCLSFPGAPSCCIDRFHEVEIKAQDEYGEWFSVKTNHLYAAVNFQHEVDHLDGITMLHRWSKQEYVEKDVVEAIKTTLNESSVCKRLKKLKLNDATKLKLNF